MKKHVRTFPILLVILTLLAACGSDSASAPTTLPLPATQSESGPATPIADPAFVPDSAITAVTLEDCTTHAVGGCTFTFAAQNYSIQLPSHGMRWNLTINVDARESLKGAPGLSCGFNTYAVVIDQIDDPTEGRVFSDQSLKLPDNSEEHMKLFGDECQGSFDVKLVPGHYTLLVDGLPTPAVITVADGPVLSNPVDTGPPPSVVPSGPGTCETSDSQTPSPGPTNGSGGCAE